MSEAYRQLEKFFARRSALGGASSILHWDSAVMLPSGASGVRGEQLSALAELMHEMITDARLGDWLEEAEATQEALSDWQRANLREMRHHWRHATAVDTELVGAFSRASIASEACWRQARLDNDFAAFLPHLEKVLGLVRETAEAKSASFGCSPYDALLDGYDPGLRSREIDLWFGDLAEFLPGFTPQAIERQKQQPAALELEGLFDLEGQRQLGLACMHALGFDFAHGRLDISTHPFCGGVPGDVRITTRYREENFTESFFGVVHETGHALYEIGLPEAWRNQPVGEARGMALHESQSLLVEMQLSRGLDFLTFAAPLVRQHLKKDGAAYTPQNLQRSVTQVQPSFIRVSADEVTYPSHIILRYRLEKALLYGELAPRDLPAAWAEGMRQLLGIVPPTDREGCLQDIHWSEGSIGYFPTYTIGAMIAAQLFAAAGERLPDLGAQIRAGNFAPLVAFLRENVHSEGSRLGTQELVEQATGRPLGTETYKAHLAQRYLGAS